MSKPGSRIHGIHAIALAFALVLGSAPFAAGDPLPSTTLPSPDEDLSTWFFAANNAVRISLQKKGDELIGRFNAYGLTEPKLLWHVDQSLGNGVEGAGARLIPDPNSDQCYIGTGPLSRMDPSTGAIKWTIPCEQIGFVQPSSSRFLSGDRLLVMGSKKCKQGTAYDALKEPCFTMIDTNTGKILWQYETKSLEYEMALGYWARVAKLQGRSVTKDKRLQIESMLASPKGNDFDFDVPGADRLVIAGERFEGISLADGSSLYRTKDKPGILRGAYDGRAFFRDGDKVTAFNASNGAEAWTFDAKSKGAYVYTLDDLVDMGQGAPDGMHDVLISGTDDVARVATATGRATWTVKRGGMSWWTSKEAFLTESGDKITAYDWAKAAKIWEAKIGSKPKPTDAGDYIVFVDGEKWASGSPTPPFRFTVANGKSGQIAWTRKDVDGKKIVDWHLQGPDRIRMENEKGSVATFNVADGSPAAAPQEIADRYLVSYVEKAKALQCHDASGTLVWERKGESGMSDASFLTGKDCVVWASKEGTVEVIGRADGKSMWSASGLKEPGVFVNPAGTCLVVQNKKDLTIVKLGS